MAALLEPIVAQNNVGTAFLSCLPFTLHTKILHELGYAKQQSWTEAVSMQMSAQSCLRLHLTLCRRESTLDITAEVGQRAMSVVALVSAMSSSTTAAYVSLPALMQRPLLCKAMPVAI